MPNKLNLMLHCGANAVGRDELAQVVTPEATKSWQPLPHAELVDAVQDELIRQGAMIVNEAHALTRNGRRYFGMMQVAYGGQSNDFDLVLGTRNSHDMSFPAGLVLGGGVFVCDNLSFSGDVKLARKHTVFIRRDLPNLVERAIGKLGALRHSQEQRFGAYKQTELADSEVNDLLIRAYDARVLSSTLIPNVLNEYRTPRHPEFAADGKTAWRLFNAFTEALKGNLAALPARTQALHGLMDQAVGLIVPPQFGGPALAA